MAKSKSGRIRPRVRDAILQSLKAGVVPRRGLQHIQVGRAAEVDALVRDIARIADGGAAVRYIIGEYGAGKTFFLQLIRQVAMTKKLVVMHGDMAPDRRIHATGGQARSLYQELVRNMSTRAMPDGGALPSVVETFVTSAIDEARKRAESPQDVIKRRLAHIQGQVGGFFFAEVIAMYWHAYDTGDEELKGHALRWLRGEFSTRTDAKRALGVRDIVTDANVYDQLKLLAQFVTLAGYKGLMVCIDEVVNLFRLSNGRARRSNYEQLLKILNDSLQGTSSHIGFIFCGTPQLLMDPRKGLYSYEALQTRLAENPFATDGRVDFSGPVIRLANLEPEDIYVLLVNIRNVYAAGDFDVERLPDSALTAFIQHCNSAIGSAYFQTPRNTIKAFVAMVSVLDQNPATRWEDLVDKANVSEDSGDELSPVGDDDGSDTPGADDELASFKL